MAYWHGRLRRWSMARSNSMGYFPAIVRSDSGPSPGTEEALRRVITGFFVGAPAYQIMTPGLIKGTRQQLKALEEMAKGLGPLKTLTFKKINPRGWDVSRRLRKWRGDWAIQPLTEGKVDLIGHTFAFLNNARPHPDREASLRRYIKSWKEVRPVMTTWLRHWRPVSAGNCPKPLNP